MSARDSGWLDGGDQPSLPYSNADTSKEAAESIRSSSSSMRELVFRVIKLSGVRGMTDDEIEIETGLPHQTASARRRELVLREKIKQSGERRKTRRGRFAHVHVVK